MPTDSLAHVPEEFREKTRIDLALHLTPAGLWDWERFDPRNDYQRHLWALFLRLCRYDREQARDYLLRVADDIRNVKRRERYVDDVLDSALVGYAPAERSGALIGVAG